MISKCNLVWFLGLNIPRGLCVSGHVVQAGFWGHLAAVRLGYITEMHWPRGPGKTPYRDWAKCNQHVQILILVYKKGDQGSPNSLFNSWHCNRLMTRKSWSSVCWNSSLKKGKLQPQRDSFQMNKRKTRWPTRTKMSLTFQFAIFFCLCSKQKATIDSCLHLQIYY